jgi:DNA-binding CsgD family transcriptional regulator
MPYRLPGTPQTGAVFRDSARRRGAETRFELKPAARRAGIGRDAEAAKLWEIGMKSQELMCARTPGQRYEQGIPEQGSASDRSTTGAGPLDLATVFDFPVPSEGRLRELFGLTATEARFAQLIASGDTVEEVAETMGIKLTTARSKLAVIFSKTETRRQTKLVALLSRIAHLG